MLLAWRRSLTLRALVTSLSLSVIIASGVSAFALTRVRDGLVNDRVQTSLRAASDGVAAATRVANSIPAPSDQGQRTAMVEAVVAAVAAPAGTSGDFEVLLLAGPDQSLLTAPERSTGQISPQSVTADLRKLVETGTTQAWQITELSFLDGSSLAGVVVGAPLYLPGIGEYELYQLFPLQREIQTLELTRSAVGIAGVLMALALVGVSLLLTRQIVRPIRRAAASAERLRSGRLTERLAVRGEDDLAVLATSFNSMAASMQEQINRLESLSRVQQRFVSDVSHELRTPLTTIRMASEMLHQASDDFDPASRRAAELLQEQSQRFEELLNDLLEISRLDAGTVKLDAAQVDVDSLCSRVVEQLGPVARGESVKLELRIPQPVGLVACDARRIERIVRNLISNAIEHAEGQPVVVSAAGDAQSVAVSVRDFGAGLQPGEAALVFNRFWRADPARQRTLGGTGLGLAISLEDAHLHDGWLDADGAPGVGAHFRMVLPRNAGQPMGEPPLPLALDEIDAWLGSHV